MKIEFQTRDGSWSTYRYVNSLPGAMVMFNHLRNQGFRARIVTATTNYVIREG